MAAPAGQGSEQENGKEKVLLRHRVEHSQTWREVRVPVRMLHMTPVRWAQVEKWGYINTCKKALGSTGCALEGCTYAHPAPGMDRALREALGVPEHMVLNAGLFWSAPVPPEWCVISGERPRAKAVWCTKDRAGQCFRPCDFVHVRPERRQDVVRRLKHHSTVEQPWPDVEATVRMPMASPERAHEEASRHGHVLRVCPTDGAVFVEFALPQQAADFVSRGRYCTTAGERRSPQKSIGPIHVTVVTQYFPLPEKGPAHGCAPKDGRWRSPPVTPLHACTQMGTDHVSPPGPTRCSSAESSVGPPTQYGEELRVDEADGQAYPRDSFLAEYGTAAGGERWARSRRYIPEAGCEKAEESTVKLQVRGGAAQCEEPWSGGGPSRSPSPPPLAPGVQSAEGTAAPTPAACDGTAAATSLADRCVFWRKRPVYCGVADPAPLESRHVHLGTAERPQDAQSLGPARLTAPAKLQDAQSTGEGRTRTPENGQDAQSTNEGCPRVPEKRQDAQGPSAQPSAERQRTPERRQDAQGPSSGRAAPDDWRAQLQKYLFGKSVAEERAEQLARALEALGCMDHDDICMLFSAVAGRCGTVGRCIAEEDEEALNVELAKLGGGPLRLLEQRKLRDFAWGAAGHRLTAARPQ
eukprot:TRINITY_DN12354_c0_g1_i1.p2 TRINITY_DN12354_c0_g1~~TRINITY_DN12354_c0_g1_i1.p2  ORF type:complete len:638 (+),score=128.13 TRINITY_DN12354_c0_g1_i1:88-2001(+)